MNDKNTSHATKPLLHKTGLPQFDQASFNKGLSDGFRGHVWWPGPGTEPLSYAAGYQESGVLNPRTRPDPGADLSSEPTPADVSVGSQVIAADEAGLLSAGRSAPTIRLSMAGKQRCSRGLVVLRVEAPEFELEALQLAGRLDDAGGLKRARIEREVERLIADAVANRPLEIVRPYDVNWPFGESSARLDD